MSRESAVSRTPLSIRMSLAARAKLASNFHRSRSKISLVRYEGPMRHSGTKRRGTDFSKPGCRGTSLGGIARCATPIYIVKSLAGGSPSSSRRQNGSGRATFRERHRSSLQIFRTIASCSLTRICTGTAMESGHAGSRPRFLDRDLLHFGQTWWHEGAS